MKKTILTIFTACAFALTAGAKEIYLYNWTEYMPDEVIEKFTAETGIKVITTTYDSNEAMYTKMKILDGSGYDLVVPSTYYIGKMREDGLLRKIDRTKLKNYKNIDEQLLNLPFDPANDYSIPYLWGNSAILVNAEYVDPATITKWDDLWRPEFKNRVQLLNDPREVFAMALLSMGYSGNTTDEKEIKAAYEKLVKLLPNVKMFDSDSAKQGFLLEEVYIGATWNGEAYMASEENDKLQFVYPEEGAVLWLDSFVIPKNAKNYDNALALIDFVLRPEIGKIIVEDIGYSTPNKAALGALDKELRDNIVINPGKDVVENGEFQLDVGDALDIYEKYWQRLKTGKK